MNFHDDATLLAVIEKINHFTAQQIPQHVLFNHYDKSRERTFFIAPDKTSRVYLDNLIRDFHRHLDVKPGSIHVHITIAREPDGHKTKRAAATFEAIPVEFSFLCDAFYLRNFNNQTRQYSDIVRKFPFPENESDFV